MTRSVAPGAAQSKRGEPTHLRIRPTADPLDAEVVSAQFRRLHQLCRPVQRGRLRRAQPPATVEVLLVSDGTPDTAVEYLVGVDGDVALDALELVCRGLFPDTYEFEPAADPLSRQEWGTEPLAAAEFCGTASRRRDWQTQLAPFESFLEDDGRVPLAGVVETMARTPLPMMYQVLFRPLEDFTESATYRAHLLGRGQDANAWQYVDTALGYEPVDSREQEAGRIGELDAKESRYSFAVTARLAVYRNGPRVREDDTQELTESGRDAQATATARAVVRDLASTFTVLGRTCYQIEGRTHVHRKRGVRVADAIAERRSETPAYDSLRKRIPGRRYTSRAIVADPAEVGGFCLLGGETLTAAGARAVGPTPSERTSLPRPPREQLQRYRGAGMALGQPLTTDGTPDVDPLVLPPALQRLHVALIGQTGAGKSTVLTNAILANRDAARGASIVIDPKGGRMVDDYLRAHYARYGSLDDVLYFDCSEVLPAISFFDVRDQLDAGVPRTTAVQDVTDHYIELLAQLMSEERFYRAVRSPDIIAYLVKALFDPVNGRDAYGHHDLHGAVREMHERQTPPAVSDPDLERALDGVVANRAQTFSDIMGGVASRIEEVTTDSRLARIFNHVTTDDSPSFDLASFLDEPVTIVLDTGDLRREAQRALTMVVLSNLWTALKRRQRRNGPDNSLVTVYIEEAAGVATSALLQELLAQAREFDCSLTLSMQFPGQFGDQEARSYFEVLNNIGTVLVGPVPHDPRLAERIATDDMPPQAVANRLRGLRRGQWLVSLPAGFDESVPRPFLARSLPLPPGHPEGTAPLTARENTRYDAARFLIAERTQEAHGLTVELPSATHYQNSDSTERTTGDATGPESTTTDSGAASDDTEAPLRIDSALPYTKRLPRCVRYDTASHALYCKTCENRYDPSIDGMRRAIECCHSLADIDREDIPVCDLNLKLSTDDRAATEWNDRQLLFVQAVYNAQQLRFDPLEYDLLRDSMLRLQEYVGIDATAVKDLVDADVLRIDTDHPHRLYSVTPDGRRVIGESYRQGVDYGHGKGDLDETSQHVFAVEIGRRYLTEQYRDDPNSPITKVVAYYDLDENRRLDVAALDADGDIRITLEAERINHDYRTAIPEDFDKMASCTPDEAIWLSMTRTDGHTILSVLNDPPDGTPRVTKTYAKGTPPQQYVIDTPGCTAIYPVDHIRDQLTWNDTT